MTKREFHTEDGETFEIIDDPAKPKGKPKPKPLYGRRRYIVAGIIAALLIVVGVALFLLPIREEARVVSATTTAPLPTGTPVVVVVTATPLPPSPTSRISNPTAEPDPCEKIMAADTGRIAFTGQIRDTDEVHLFLIDDAGRELCQLENVPVGSGPHWSHDGERLLYAVQVDEGGNYPHWEIVMLDVRSGESTYITYDENNSKYAPFWSPDESRIVFQGQYGNLFTINSDSANRQPLTTDTGRNEDPVWSPDGQWIAFASTRGYPEDIGKRDNFELYLIAPDGSNLRRLTNNALFDHMPTWSPNSNQIAYVAKVDPESDARTDLFVIDANCDQLPAGCEANRRNLTNSGVGITYPRWLSDSQHIAYITNEGGGNEAIYLLDLDTGKRERITRPIIRVHEFDWWEH